MALSGPCVRYAVTSLRPSKCSARSQEHLLTFATRQVSIWNTILDGKAVAELHQQVRIGFVIRHCPDTNAEHTPYLEKTFKTHH